MDILDSNFTNSNSNTEYEAQVGSYSLLIMEMYD